MDPTSITLNGATVSPSTTYRVTVNNFMATGGDHFTVFKAGLNVQNGMVDIDAFVNSAKTHGPLSPNDVPRVIVK